MPPRVILKPRRARPFFARHPWVLSNSIDRVEGEPAPGAEVEVVTHDLKPIARGLYNPNSKIRVRLYRWDGGPLDEAFWREKIASAIQLRKSLPGRQDPEGAVRLVYSEGDGLSGLTVDRYGSWLVVQITSLAIHQRRELLYPLLAELSGAEGILLRGDKGIADQEGLKVEEGHAYGEEPPPLIEVVDQGLRYDVDVRTGQKTGLYIDQHDNRRAAAAYFRGRRVLDLFCHAGGFGLNAIKHGGASSVLGVDGSQTVIEMARHNASMNGLENLEFRAGDVLETLRELRAEEQRFDAVICDPPKFARHPGAVEDALKGYFRVNAAAVELLNPNGILVTCSCSGLVDRGLFLDVIGQVAEQSGRPIQVIEQRSQGPDHPVSASCLETEYLKCLICRVA